LRDRRWLDRHVDRHKYLNEHRELDVHGYQHRHVDIDDHRYVDWHHNRSGYLDR
jgi:hypothetical protein